MKTFWMIAALSTVLFGQTKPNVILIYGDDVGYGDISVHGGLMPTPNLDKLAEEGLDFTDMHTTSSTCTPSRFGLLTGEYPWRYPGTGIASPTASLIPDTNMYTLPDMFKEAGYATAFVGKWHLGIGGNGGADYAGEVKPGPLELGFDESFIIPSTGDRVPSVYVEGHDVVNADLNDPISIGGREVLNISNVTQYPVELDDPHLATVYSASNAQHSNTIINGVGRIGYMAGGGSAVWSDEDMADDLVARAEKFVVDHKDNPFFLWFSSHDIHVPRVPHPRFRVTPQSWRGDAMVQLDWCVGALRTILEENGLDTNTIIIFSSDNGPVVLDGYDDNAQSNLNGHKPWGIYRGTKYSVWEAGTRVPGIVWWPNIVQPGTSSGLMNQLDFLASFAGFLDVELPSGKARDSENHFRALIGIDTLGRETSVANGSGSDRALRLDSWKLIVKTNGNHQLYNLENDITEQNNIISSNQAMADSLLEIYNQIVAGTYVPPIVPVKNFRVSKRRPFIQEVNRSRGALTFTLMGDYSPVDNIDIFNLKGDKVASLKVKVNRAQWAPRNQPPGIYLAKVVGGSGTAFVVD